MIDPSYKPEPTKNQNQEPYAEIIFNYSCGKKQSNKNSFNINGLLFPFIFPSNMYLPCNLPGVKVLPWSKG